MSNKRFSSARTTPFAFGTTSSKAKQYETFFARRRIRGQRS